MLARSADLISCEILNSILKILLKDLDLICLKYSDAFEELYTKLKHGDGEYEGADPENRDEYKIQFIKIFLTSSFQWNEKC